MSIPGVSIKTSEGAPLNMPIIGMGTSTIPAALVTTVTAALVEAIKVGYRHFDTAALYGSEEPLGLAITEALRLGLIASRDELFITTKLWCNATQRHLVLPAIKKSLSELGLEYVDLYLIHGPLMLTQEVFEMPIPKDSIFDIDIKAVWEAMEECVDLGLTKAIGVSNFSSKRLQDILSFAKIPPVVNQVEMNPLWQQKELKSFCEANNIILTAYAPLGANGNSWGDNRIFECNMLEDIAKTHGKTTAQVSLRWLYEQGVTMIPKSYNTKRMKENLEIFDWSLTMEELMKISQIPQRKGFYISSMTEASDVVTKIDAEL